MQATTIAPASTMGPVLVSRNVKPQHHIMRKEYTKALRKAFDAQMAAVIPDFAVTKPQSKFAFPGERYYCRSIGDKLRLWIALVPNPKAEEFTVEVGWSRLGRFPELPARPPAFVPTVERVEFSRDEYFTRLACLWSKDDYWWSIESFDFCDIMGAISQRASPVTPEAARQKVAPMVEDAIAKLRVYGLPYLDEFHKIAA